MGRDIGRFVRRSRAPRTTPEAANMVAGCESFLIGQSLEAWHESTGSIPEWVWINVLAHGSEEYLAACASGGTKSYDSGIWSRTVSFLAGLLLDHAARTGTPVAQLQRDIVVPIELLSRPVAPSTCVRLVMSALGEQPVPAAPTDGENTDAPERVE